MGFAGSWHDSFVLKDSGLWTHFTDLNWMPIEDGLCLGDGAYEGFHGQSHFSF